MYLSLLTVTWESFPYWLTPNQMDLIPTLAQRLVLFQSCLRTRCLPFANTSSWRANWNGDIILRFNRGIRKAVLGKETRAEQGQSLEEAVVELLDSKWARTHAQARDYLVCLSAKANKTKKKWWVLMIGCHKRQNKSTSKRTHSLSLLNRYSGASASE